MKMPSLTWLAQSVERGSNKVRIQYMRRTNKYKTNSNIQSPFKTTAQGHGCKYKKHSKMYIETILTLRFFKQTVDPRLRQSLIFIFCNAIPIHPSLNLRYGFARNLI